MSLRNLLYSRMLRVGLPVLMLIFCGYRFLWLACAYSVNVFIGDQWVYNEPTLFHRQSLWTIFRWQSGPWRQGLGGLLAVLIGSLTRWNSRYESFIASALIIAGCVLALYLKIRLAGKLTAWDVLIPLFVLSPVEYQTIVGVTHYSHGPLPFLLLMLFCLAWTIRRYTLKYALAVVMAFLCTYTGFGIFVGMLCPLMLALDLWIRRKEIDEFEKRAAVIALALAGFSLLSFFMGFTFSDGVCPPHAFANPASGIVVRYPNPLHYWLFVAFMFANYVGLKATLNLVPAILAGSAVLFFVVAGFLIARKKRRLPLIPLFMISYSLLFAVTTAQGRMCLGLGTAIGSRYMIYLVPAFIGIYLLALSDSRGTELSLLMPLAIIAFASSTTVHAPDRDDMVILRNLRSEWKQCYLSEHDLRVCNTRTKATILSYPDTIQQQIDYLEQNRLNFYRDAAASGN